MAGKALRPLTADVKEPMSKRLDAVLAKAARLSAKDRAIALAHAGVIKRADIKKAAAKLDAQG